MGKKEPKLSWEDVLKQFENLIKFACKQQIERNPSYNDAMISAEDLYQEGMIKLYDCWLKWCVEEDKDMDEFGPIFRVSLFRCMKQTNKRFTYVDIEDTVNTLKDENTYDVIGNMYRENMIKNLNDALENPVSKSLLQEIIEPSKRTLYEVEADIARRKMLRSQGKRVNVPKSNAIRMKHIARSLGITPKQYDNAMLEIRQKASLVVDV